MNDNGIVKCNITDLRTSFSFKDLKKRFTMRNAIPSLQRKIVIKFVNILSYTFTTGKDSKQSLQGWCSCSTLASHLWVFGFDSQTHHHM